MCYLGKQVILNKKLNNKGKNKIPSSRKLKTQPICSGYYASSLPGIKK